MVTNSGGEHATLAGAFTVTAPGKAHFVYQLILPSQMGRHISSTIYVDYSNTGTVAMPAPLLVLYAPEWSTARRHNLADDAQPSAGGLGLLDLRACPRAIRTPWRFWPAAQQVPGMARARRIYFCSGILRRECNNRGVFAETSFQFAMDYYTQHDTTAGMDWSSLEASLQPPGISNAAWSAIFGGLTSQTGRYMGRLREPRSTMRRRTSAISVKA